MPFSLVLPQDSIQVEPGTTTAFSVEIENNSAASETVEIGVSGVDGEWVAIPVPTTEIAPSSKQAIKLFFNPPRTSVSNSGSYPFVIRVRSLLSAESHASQAVLTIMPFHHISLELTPRRGTVSAAKRQNVFSLSLINMGNTEHLFALSGDDPEDACIYEFDEEQIRLAAGQQKEVDFAVNPRKQSPLGGTRLVGFAITARSTSGGGVSATAQAQLEVRPFLSPATVIVAGVITLLGIVVWTSQPKSPSIQLSVIGQRKVFQGDKIAIRWTAENATTVSITSGGLAVETNLSPEGTLSIPANLIGTLRIEAVAQRDRRSSEPARVSIEVSERPYVAPPSILVLEPSKSVINRGDSFTLKYKFGKSVVKAKLAPLNIMLDLNVDSYLIRPTDASNDYTVVVENSDGVLAKKEFNVKVVEPILVTIPRFTANPMALDTEGEVTLEWQVVAGTRVELSYPGSGQAIILPMAGTSKLNVKVTTKFKLVAYDINGRTQTKTLTVTVKPVKDPSVPPTIDPNLRNDETTGTTSGTPPGSGTAGATTSGATGGTTGTNSGTTGGTNGKA